MGDLPGLGCYIFFAGYLLLEDHCWLVYIVYILCKELLSIYHLQALLPGLNNLQCLLHGMGYAAWNRQSRRASSLHCETTYDHATCDKRPISQVSSNLDAVNSEKALAGKVVGHFWSLAQATMLQRVSQFHRQATAIEMTVMQQSIGRRDFAL